MSGREIKSAVPWTLLAVASVVVALSVSYYGAGSATAFAKESQVAARAVPPGSDGGQLDSQSLTATSEFGTAEDCVYSGPEGDGYSCLPDGEFLLTAEGDGGGCIITETFNWGDGTVQTETVYPDPVSHTYTKPGLFQVYVTGTATSSDPDVECSYRSTRFVVEVPFPGGPPDWAERYYESIEGFGYVAKFDPETQQVIWVGSFPVGGSDTNATGGTG